MYPARDEAERILQDGERCNPGPWSGHSRVAARCAEAIAAACGELDPEKAYVLGLLHDIGRKFGKRHLGHVSDGYAYMLRLGYDDAARICLTHSFHNASLSEFIGQIDTTPDETALVVGALSTVQMDEYDRLIQLCDAVAGVDGPVDMEARMDDVERRYGSYPASQRESNRALRRHFEKMMGKDLYEVIKQVKPI